MDSSNQSEIKAHDQDTPQGGMISPLLSNIALHGLEEFCLEKHKEIVYSIRENWQVSRNQLHLIRYADDFIVIHPIFKVLEEIQKYIGEFLLKEMDLELNDTKTYISSTLNKLIINNEVVKPGFDFLGFHFKIYRSKNYPAKNSKGKIVGYRPQIKPSFKNIVNHLNEIRTVVKKHRGLSQSILINKLSPIINGWTNYYKYSSAKRAFSYCDNTLYFILYDWALNRHPTKTRKGVLENYFRRYKKRAWVFSCYPDNVNIKVMPFHVTRKIETYHRTKKNFSVFDPEQVRTVESMKLEKASNHLFIRQKGICRWCLAPMVPGDTLEIHHTLGNKHPKRNYEVYKWLIHGHCHDELHKEFKGNQFPFLKQ